MDSLYQVRIPPLPFHTHHLHTDDPRQQEDELTQGTILAWSNSTNPISSLMPWSFCNLEDSFTVDETGDSSNPEQIFQNVWRAQRKREPGIQREKDLL